jgi:predicted ATPase/DNA-binding winged helix-turn-helix (wHTH) protein
VGFLWDFCGERGTEKMQADQVLSFGPYRLDLRNGQLWRGTHIVKLLPKAVAVLCHFVQHAGQLVTKEDLFQTVWPETVVSEATLTSCIQELRQALHDNARKPRYIETVHRRGYRFMGKVASSQYPGVSRGRATSESPLATGNRQLTTSLVGRETELRQLHEWLDKALSGERQLIFVTGEAGIGKTTLVDAFLARLTTAHEHGHDHDLWLGRGQCIEHYGAGEAYLPILEALGRLCRAPDGQHLIALLRHHAPTWLVQMSVLLTAAEREALQRTTAGATKERMLRELAEAVEVLTAQCPLVLWLEDLQWGDYSTLDWLAFAARRREPCRLLVIGTYRPVDVLAREHPLKGVKQELQVHGQCEELALDFLREEHVAEYLMQRFPAPSPAPAGEGQGEGLLKASLQYLAHTIHRYTDGNPLFMVTVVNELVARGVLVQSDGEWELKGKMEEVADRVPESLQQMIEQQIERLTPEKRQILEVASVVGVEFSAAAVAAGRETTVETVEEQCAELARRELFLRAGSTGEWPDGTITTRYSFQHALYQEVLYKRLTARRRQQLHQQIGEREEQVYGERAREIAAELAVHFEQGREYRKAVQYLQQAGESAVRQSAHQEAINLLTRGLELLQTLPDTPERAQRELMLQISRGVALVATRGYGDPEVERAYTRARELCRQLGETPQLFPALRGLWGFHFLRGELRAARELGERLFTFAQHTQDPTLLIEAHYALGATLHQLGELTSARTHVEQGIILYNLHQHRSNAFLYGHDPGVACRCHAAYVLWWLGYPDQALGRSQEALAVAQTLFHPNSLAFAPYYVAAVHLLRREDPLAREHVEALIALSTEHGFSHWLGNGFVLRGLALAMQGQPEEGLTQLRQGLTANLATGAGLARMAALPGLAQAYGYAGRAEEGLPVVAEALAEMDKTGARLFEAGLSVIKGWLLFLLSVENHAETAACFQKAIDIARQQQAKMWELRATVSLARLWQRQGKKKQARQMLAEIYGWFTEGFDTKDLKEARALLEELGGTEKR